MNEEILVSIWCTAYNHESYIRQCLEGFVMQKTNFKFEAIVHDDASTDSTAAIIMEYAEKYPDIIQPIFQIENQYSQKHINMMQTFFMPRAKGKYIALCEGDDYWTDPYKLQRQVDFLENHHDYSLSAENALRLYLSTNKVEKFSDRDSGDVLVDELIIIRQFATASVLFRKKALVIPDNVNVYDTFLWCLIAQSGKIHYLDIVSSVYRDGSGITRIDKIAWAYQLESLHGSLFSYFNFKYRAKLMHNREFVGVLFSGLKDALICFRYKDVFKLLVKSLKVGILPIFLFFLRVIKLRLTK